MNYYIQNEEEKIVLFDTELERLNNTLAFMPQYADLEIQETEREIVLLDNEFVFADEHQEEIAQKERERLNNLTQTRADVWRALIQARMFPKSQVKAMIEQMPEETDEQKMAKEIARIDVDDVEDFHRGHELVNLVGDYLGITSENLDLYFETGDYHYLEEQPEPEPEVVDEEEIIQDEPEIKESED